MNVKPAGGAVPELRQDLRLVGRTTDLAGNALWKIYDPLHHRFVALNQRDYALLDVWSVAGGHEAIAAAAWDRHAVLASLEDIEAFAQFLLSSGLALSATPEAWRPTFEVIEKRRTDYAMRILHNYLFFRVPLVRPEQYLTATLPLVRWIGRRFVAYALAAIALFSLFMVSREWDRFVASAIDLASVTGAVGVIAAIAVVKIFHELGHGYAAVHFGCRVPTAGVAFILGAPLLYVDVTDSWKLKSQKERLIIDSAGIAVDLTVSILATLLWVFLPDGTMRSAAFSFATAGWITSLLFNLNPLMKFDGYHLLVDGLAMPNLQERAIDMSRWLLREVLFDLRLEPPETIATHFRTALVWYGVSIWIYRLIIFTSIALAVYNYFFKALGVILFAVEIGYFIIKPFWLELKEWFVMRTAIAKSRRAGISLMCGLLILTGLVVPWSTQVGVPATLEPVQAVPLHVSVAAKVVSVAVRHDSPVAAGAPLVHLSSSNLDQELKLARLKADIVDLRLARLAGDASERESAVVLERERLSLEQSMAGIRQRIAELRVVAPSAGTVTSLLPYLSTGRWVTQQEPVAVLLTEGVARVRGLVEATDRGRLRPGMRAKFIPNDLHQAAIDCVVTEVASVNAAAVEQRELASSFGGTVPTRLGKGGKAVPTATQYAVTASIATDGQDRPIYTQPQVGFLLVQGDQQSILYRVWNRVLIVLIRESGF